MWESIGKLIGSLIPNGSQSSGAVRNIVMLVLGLAVGKGWIPKDWVSEYGDTVVVLVGSIIVLISSVRSNSDSALANTVASRGNIVITRDTELANSIPNPNVIPKAAVQVKVVAPEVMNQGAVPIYPTGNIGGGSVT